MIKHTKADLQFLRIVTLVGAIIFATDAWGQGQPQIPQRGTPAMPGLKAPFYFAFPGTSCPPGSTLYQGPETQQAAAAGAVYCEFRRTVFVFSKDKLKGGKCPDDLLPSADSPKDASVVWCKPPAMPQQP